MADYENIIKHYDLYKSYGEFNFRFEDTIQEYRLLIIALIRISYEYFEEEDNEQRELSYIEQDRLLKIMMNNMGAMEIIENCKACFIDFFTQQKHKYNEYAFKWYDDDRKISDASYDFAINIFKKSLELVKLRNILIHSNFSESKTIYQISRKELQGQKDFKTSKGFEQRNYSFGTNTLEIINNQIETLYFLLKEIRFILYLPDAEKENYIEESKQLNSINFNIKHANEQ